jgi:peptidoglycan glycosyltransferase
VNRALKRLSIAVLVMFLLLLINVNFIQGFQTASLASKPHNPRAFYSKFAYQRGDITTSDGVVIAKSQLSSASDYANYGIKYQRVYPHGAEYAPVTGYDTIDGHTPTGQTGLEYYEDSVLTGSDASLTVRNFIDMLTGKQRKGASVAVTISSKAQDAAYAGLVKTLQGTGRIGAVVAIEPSTGKILAMASYPSYDPNQLAVLSGVKLNTNDNALLKAPTNPLLNKAIGATFPPGSTFKIVTSSAFFNVNPGNNPNSIVESPTQLTLPQTNHTLANDLGEVCGDGSGHTTLIQAFLQSCDTTFGKLGMNVGANSLNSAAQSFGMNSSSLKIPMPVTPSNYVLPPSQALTAYSAIGQFSDTVTAMQEAMFAAAIASSGKLMTPYLVQQVTASDLSNVQTTQPAMLNQAVSPAVASNVRTMMEAVVQNPGGTAAAFSQAATHVDIAGKTGTAENGPGNASLNDAVFTAFAPAGNGNPTIAVGVIIQGGGYGATAAAPIAVQVIKAYLGIR